jgi:hypothetical protein
MENRVLLGIAQTERKMREGLASGKYTPEVAQRTSMSFEFSHEQWRKLHGLMDPAYKAGLLTAEEAQAAVGYLGLKFGPVNQQAFSVRFVLRTLLDKLQKQVKLPKQQPAPAAPKGGQPLPKAVSSIKLLPVKVLPVKVLPVAKGPKGLPPRIAKPAKFKGLPMRVS